MHSINPRRTVKTILLCSIATIGMPTAAMAQASQGDPATASNQDSAVITDIVVTAQRRSENLQRVPIAVTAATAERLEAAGVVSAGDLAVITPSFSFTNTVGAFQGRIRGVGASTVGAGIESPVAVYVDGVYYGAAPASTFSFADVERVEVLKGPQGTLFGRNATGGVINVVTREPSTDIEGKIELGYGNYDVISANGYVAGGLAEGLSGSLSFTSTTQGKGFGTNLANGTDVNKTDHDMGVRAKLLFEPTDATRIRLSMDYSDSQGSFPAGRSLIGAKPLLGPVLDGSPWDVSLDGKPLVALKQGGASLNIEQDLGGLKLVSITAYRKTEFTQYIDLDATATPGLYLPAREKDRQFSQELQLQSDPSSPVKWVAGGYYYWSKAGYPTWDLFFNGPFLASGLHDIHVEGYQSTRSYAAFGQVTVPVTSTTNITGGLRYTSDRKSIDATQTLTFTNGFILATPVDAARTFNKLTWRLSVDQQFSNVIMGYASFNRGFKSGGYTTTTPSDPAYSPEVLDAYEVGLKMSLFDRRIRFNPSFFYYDYSNLQFIQLDSQGQNHTVNGPSAKLYGLDADVEWAVSRALHINAGISWIHGRFGDFPTATISTPLPGGGNSQAPGQAKGNQIPYTASFSSSLGFSYTVDLKNGSIELGGDWNHSSGFFTEVDNNVRQKSYDRLNASISWKPGNDGFYVRVWGKNLANEAVIAFANSTGAVTGASYLPPRTFGGTVGIKF